MLVPNLRAGVENLLLNCGQLSAGDTLLILHEQPGHDYYEDAFCSAVAELAQELDITTTIRLAPEDAANGSLPSDYLDLMRSVNRTLFLSRSGDQIRFSHEISDIRPIMCYALDQAMLSSGFGWASYPGFVRLKNAVNALLGSASEIRVTCPLGTDFSGPRAAFAKTPVDTTVDRFPMLVFAPVPATGFSGVVVQDGFLVGTGSKFYDPYSLELSNPIGVHFDESRLTKIDGSPKDVAAARAHYEFVGEKFGLDPFTMHSWHAGIHPGSSYSRPAAGNFERWAGGAFGNPRLLHFHTCGDYAPGEISLNVLDPTITVDGVDVWSTGRLDPFKIPGGAELLEEYACMKWVFDHPSDAVGQGANGRLCGRV